MRDTLRSFRKIRAHRNDLFYPAYASLKPYGARKGKPVKQKKTQFALITMVRRFWSHINCPFQDKRTQHLI